MPLHLTGQPMSNTKKKKASKILKIEITKLILMYSTREREAFRLSLRAHPLLFYTQFLHSLLSMHAHKWEEQPRVCGIDSMEQPRESPTPPPPPLQDSHLDGNLTLMWLLKAFAKETTFRIFNISCDNKLKCHLNMKYESNCVSLAGLPLATHRFWWRISGKERKTHLSEK